MDTASDWFIIIFPLLLGVGLLLNPLYLYPDGNGDSRITYTVEEVENETAAKQALGQHDQILRCPSERPCALEERILEDDSVEYDGHLQRGQSYPVVWIGENLFLPRNKVENRTARLELEGITPIEAIEHAAVPADEFGPDVRTAVETGSVTVYGERVSAFERGEIVRYNEKYYWNDGYRSDSPTWARENPLLLARGTLFTIGSMLVFYAGWITRKVFERTDSQ